MYRRSDSRTHWLSPSIVGLESEPSHPTGGPPSARTCSPHVRRLNAVWQVMKFMAGGERSPSPRQSTHGHGAPAGPRTRPPRRPGSRRARRRTAPRLRAPTRRPPCRAAAARTAAARCARRARPPRSRARRAAAPPARPPPAAPARPAWRRSCRSARAHG